MGMTMSQHGSKGNAGFHDVRGIECEEPQIISGDTKCTSFIVKTGAGDFALDFFHKPDTSITLAMTGERDGLQDLSAIGKGENNGK